MKLYIKCNSDKSSMEYVLDSQNHCYVEDAGAKFLYSANPAFFDKYFKSMSIPGFKVGGYSHYCKVLLNIKDEIIQAIPTAAKKRIGISKQGYSMEFEVESVVTADSLNTWVPKSYERDYAIGNIKPITSFSPKREPASLDIDDIFDTTFDSKAISEINNTLSEIYIEYQKAVKMAGINSNYREMSSTQLVKYLLKNRFRNSISVSVEEYGVPRKYENRPRQAGSMFDDVIYDIDAQAVSSNGYNLFVEPKSKGEMNIDIAYQVNYYINELIQDKYLNDLGVVIDAGFDLNSLDNDIGFKKNDAWKDFIVLGFSVSGPNSLFVDIKSKKLSDVVLN